MGWPALLQLGRAPKGNYDNNSYKRSKKKAGYLYWGKGKDRYWISKKEVSFKADGGKDSGIL
jgi:hypothetical protein